MIAILGGLGAALLWGTATVSSSRVSRLIGPTSTLSWVMLVGLVVAAPAAAVVGVPAGLDANVLAWLGVAGLGNVAGLLLEYRGLRVGKVGIVASIASTEGAIAAAIAVAAGERLSLATGLLLLLITVGVALASLTLDPAPAGAVDGHRTSAAAAYAMGAAACFGIGLYAVGHVGGDVTVPWVLVSARLIGVGAVAAPVAIAGRLRIRRAAVPLVVLSGFCELLGFASFTIGSRHGIAVTAVLASQFGAISALAAFVLFRERLARLQLAGVAMIVLGVAVLASLRA